MRKAGFVGEDDGLDPVAEPELEPDIGERKTYARGVGIIKTERILGGTEVTILESFEPPSASAPAQARTARWAGLWLATRAAVARREDRAD